MKDEASLPGHSNFCFRLFHDSFDGVAILSNDPADEIIVRKNLQRNFPAKDIKQHLEKSGTVLKMRKREEGILPSIRSIGLLLHYFHYFLARCRATFWRPINSDDLQIGNFLSLGY